MQLAAPCNRSAASAVHQPSAANPAEVHGYIPEGFAQSGTLCIMTQVKLNVRDRLKGQPDGKYGEHLLVPSNSVPGTYLALPQDHA